MCISSLPCVFPTREECGVYYEESYVISISIIHLLQEDDPVIHK
jgi:hypothetical protein